ncbi:MAG: HAD family hydrolase [Flavobacteriales bacterium]
MSSHFDGIRHISLDVWSTLIEPNPKFKNARTVLFRHFFNLEGTLEQSGTALSETAAMVNQLNAISGKCMDRSETILLALQRMGYSIQNTSEERLRLFFREMDDLFLLHPPFLASPELPDLMGKLMDKFSFSILSNTLYIQGSSLHHFFAEKQMSSLFRFELYSDEINSSKPSATAYEKLIHSSEKLCGVRPEEIIHLGDNPINDVEGAVKAGLRAALVSESQPLVSYFRA